jgi:hypothetical protein
MKIIKNKACLFKRCINNISPTLARLLLIVWVLQSCGGNLPHPEDPNPSNLVYNTSHVSQRALPSAQSVTNSVPSQSAEQHTIQLHTQPAQSAILQQNINVVSQHAIWTDQPIVGASIVQAPRPMQALQQQNSISVPMQPAIWTSQSTVLPSIEPMPYPIQAIPQTTSLPLPFTIMSIYPGKASLAVSHQGSGIHASHRPSSSKDTSATYLASHASRTSQAVNSKRKFAQMVRGEKEIALSRGQTNTDKRPKHLPDIQQVGVKIEKETESIDQYNISTNQKTSIQERKHSIVKQETAPLIKDQLELERMLQEAIDELDHGYSLNADHLLKVTREIDSQPSDNSHFLATELIEHILTYLPLKELLDVRRWNRYFNRLIGDYPVLCGIGMQNKLQSALYIPSLKKECTVECSATSIVPYGDVYMDLNSSSSFFFYQLLGSIKNLPLEYWQYLKGTNVHTLEFHCNHYESTGLSDLFKHLDQTRVSKIVLRGYHRLNYDQIVSFTAAMSSSQIKKLELDGDPTNENEFKRTLFINMLLPNSAIEALTLRNTWSSPCSNDVKQLAALLPRSKIKKLKLDRIIKINKSLMILADVLPKTHVKVLELPDLAYVEMSCLFNALRNSKVRRLNLAYKQGMQPHKPHIGINSLASILPFTQLEELDLTNNKIYPVGIKALAAVLPNTKLKKINLTHNFIDADAILALAKVLPKSCLEEIYLCSEQIKASGITAITKLLANSSIKRIHIGSNHITPSLACRIATALKRSQVEEFRLYSKEIPMLEAAILIRKLTDTPVKIVGFEVGEFINQIHIDMLIEALRSSNIKKVFLRVYCMDQISLFLPDEFKYIKRCLRLLNIECIVDINVPFFGDPFYGHTLE